MTSSVEVYILKIRDKELDFAKHTYIMGILNATPDSFSDGGQHFHLDEAVMHAKRMIEEGADIIDVGGESTRPGFQYISAEEEIERVVPVIREIRKFSDIPISVDTTKSEVFEASYEAGADIINDVSGFLLDKKMGELAAKLGVVSILMHDGFYFNDSKISNDTVNMSLLMEKSTDPKQYTLEVLAELKVIADGAKLYGVSADKIILDPGIGFGKTLKQNLILLHEMDKMELTGYPILLGCSRKSVIGKSLDLPVDERLEGTITTSVLAAKANVGIVRVHDVKENLRAIKMYEAIRNSMI